LNRVIAIAMVDAPLTAIKLIDRLAPELDHYHLFYAARADLLRQMGASEAAAQSYVRALELATNDSERRFLDRRLHEVQPP
jgi:RNA polymerase sigma-70 factor (ECF subfamily)